MCSRDWNYVAMSRMNLCDQERLGFTLPTKPVEDETPQDTRE